MSKFAHDNFAKNYLEELLTTIGRTTPSRPIKSEVRAADLWFERGSASQEALFQLGLLADLLTKDSLIEVFRNPATAFEIRACKGKLYSLEGEFLRKAKREKQTLSQDQLPALLILMPTASEEIRSGFGAIETNIPGVYSLPVQERTTLVIIHQLPNIPETLWLRILGRSGNQKRAIDEFLQLPETMPLYVSIGEILADYRANLEVNRKLTQEEEELIMNLSAAYLQKRSEWKKEGLQEGLREGLQEGLQEGVHKVARNLLRQGMTIVLVAKATELTIDQVKELRDQL